MGAVLRLCCYLHLLLCLLLARATATFTPPTTYPPLPPSNTTAPTNLRPPPTPEKPPYPQYYIHHLCTPTTTTTTIAPATNLNIDTLINSSNDDPRRDGYVRFAAQQQYPSYLVFGHFLCKSGVLPDYCLDCVQAARDKLIDSCHTDRTSEAIVYFEDCLLRYSTRPFFTAFDTTPVVYLKSLLQASDPSLFNHNLTNLLESLKTQLVSLGTKFASSSVDVYGAGGADDDDDDDASAKAGFRSSLKGMLQCIPDMRMNDCEACVREAIDDIPRCCNGNIGARVIRPSCSLRYDFGDFYQSKFSRQVLNVSYPISLPLSSPDRASKRTLIAVLSSGGASIVLFALVMVWLWRRKSCSKQVKTLLKKKSENSQNIEAILLNQGSLSLKRYKYLDVKKMTNSFQVKLGQGGYGSVYKGSFLDGRMVAVKLLSESKGDGKDFINEIASISRTSHVNIVALLGFCIEDRRRALVYEFMPNGSLEKFIYGSAGDQHLGWKKLYDIAIGIARGLEYLHRGCSTKILHFDIKPHNILLDQDFSPKISDFGLSKLCLAKESAISMTGARGTAGYIAPELISRNFGAVSHKSDVYSYGMMVLEIVGGRKNVDVKAANTSQIYFPKWIYDHLHLSEDLQLQGITTAEDEEIARKMVLVGLSCIQIDPSHRPPMNKVLEMLDGRLEALQIPPSPFLSSPPRALVEELSTISGSSSKPRECNSSASTS